MAVSRTNFRIGFSLVDAGDHYVGGNGKAGLLLRGFMPPDVVYWDMSWPPTTILREICNEERGLNLCGNAWIGHDMTLYRKTSKPSTLQEMLNNSQTLWCFRWHPTSASMLKLSFGSYFRRMPASICEHALWLPAYE